MHEILQAASCGSIAIAKTIAKTKPLTKKLLPDQNSSRLIPHPDCPKGFSFSSVGSTLRECVSAVCLPANRPHLLPQELDIQGILIPFSSLRFLSNTFYRMYVGTAIPCNFDQVVPDTQNTPKVHISDVRPWPHMQKFVMNSLEFLTDKTYPSSLSNVSLYGFFKIKKTLVLVVSPRKK